MKELLALPIELQIVLFAGYIGYQISTMGRAVTHRTEDVLFQVLSFGTIARLIVALVTTTLSTIRSDLIVAETTRLIIVGFGTVGVSLLVSSLWRAKLSSVVSCLMGAAGIYRDDHESSVWRSILATDAEWTYVQLHCDDGRIYESDFSKLPDDLPGGKLTLNDDGIAMYVTQLHRADNTSSTYEITSAQHGATIDYFPRSAVKRIEIGWRK